MKAPTREHRAIAALVAKGEFTSDSANAVARRVAEYDAPRATVRVFSDGRFYRVALNPETACVLENCVRDNDAYLVVRNSEREICLRNQVTL